MKLTLTTILVILVLASLLNSENPFSAETKVEAQPSAQVAEDSLSVAIDRYLETEAELKKQRAHTRRSATEKDQSPHREAEELSRKRHHQARREHEHHVDQQRHRIQKIHVAAKHLEEAGLPELAHQVHREAEEQQQRLQQHLEHVRHPDPAPHQEVQNSLQQLRNEINELKREVHELRSILVEHTSKSAE